jgi:hypothetical protein
MADYTRQTAIPCTLADISSGAWVQKSGMEPSGVSTVRGFVSRASVIGVIVEKSDAAFSLDDGTRMVRVQSFDNQKVRPGIGDIVLVIGRPREYNNQRYLVLEICKKLRDPAWAQYRRKELSLLPIEGFSVPTAVPASVSEEFTVTTAIPGPVVEPEKNPFERLVEAIRELDTGNGASVDDVLARAGVQDGGKLLQTLLEEGEVFEIRPGRMKVLE